MKSKLYLLSVVGVLGLLLSNFTADRTSSFIITMLDERPTLPDTPFNYEDIDIPDHIKKPSVNTDTIFGYETGGIDTTQTFTV